MNARADLRTASVVRGIPERVPQYPADGRPLRVLNVPLSDAAALRLNS